MRWRSTSASWSAKVALPAHVYSPVLAKRELYELSGHWQHFRDDMYPPMTVGSGAGDPGGEQMVLRPSLCPHHAVMYRSRAHSYRDLPLRMAELGGQYRSELSGVLGGLTRVRGMQLNDAHIFCTLNQAAAEASMALAMIGQAHRALGVEPARYRLSLASSSAKYVGSPQMWDRATAMLRDVLAAHGVAYDTEEGEAAFYGPKIDVQVADSTEREASIATVQIDFYQPERIAHENTGPDGAKHRPVMVHRSIIGSIERAVAHLIDTTGGAFTPVAWPAPASGPAGIRRAAPGCRGACKSGHRPGPASRGIKRRQPRQSHPSAPPGALPSRDRRKRGSRRRSLNPAPRRPGFAGHVGGRGDREDEQPGKSQHGGVVELTEGW